MPGNSSQAESRVAHLMHFGVVSEDVLLRSTFDAITSVEPLARRREEIAV